jgi:diapolycopene oxygenase
MKDRTVRVAVIGGGLGGLAAACTLAARGHAVTLFEANPWLGGKAAVLHDRGFRFDMGPTILTVPRVLARVFEEAGRRMSDYLDLVPLDPQWRCFFDGTHGGAGDVLDLTADVAQMKRTLASFSRDPRDADRYATFIDYSARLHDISDRFFFWRSIGTIRDMMDPKVSFNLATLKDVLAMRMGRSVAGTVRNYISDPRVAQMIDHFTQYVGSCPDASPAVLCGIAHMQTRDGVWYPMGGTRAVPEALERLAAELGVEVVTGAEVERIENDGRRVSGVALRGGERREVDAVVSNMDAVRTYQDLIGGDLGKRFARQRAYEPACSGVVLYLGLRERYDHLLHHDFVFSRDAEEEFDAIYHKGEPAPDPTCYLAAPARTDPAAAPPGGEALYVLVHTPYLRPHHDWKAILPRYRRVILDKLKRTGGMADIEERIVVEHALTPQDIQDRYRVLNGAIYGLASHGKFFGAFKPSNRRPDLAGLYLAGGAAHPGPGMPMVLMSGWIAADSLDRDQRGTAAKTDPAATAQTLTT